MSRHGMPQRFCGSPRMPSETREDGNADYISSECITRPLTSEERIKYGIDKAVTPEQITSLRDNGLSISQVANQLKTSSKAVVIISRRNGAHHDKKKEEPEVSNDKLTRFTKEMLAEKLEQGRKDGKSDNDIFREIDKQYFTTRPQAQAMAARCGLIDGKKKSAEAKLETKVEAKKNSEDVFRLAAMVEELAKRVVVLETSSGIVNTLIDNHQRAIEKLQDNYDSLISKSNYLTKRVGELACDLEKIKELEKDFTRHRHQIGSGHYSEVPAKV